MTSQKESGELKACPFCGERKDLSVGELIDDFRTVECPCGADGPVGHNEKAAITLWNTRTQEPTHD